jgi:integrase
VAGFAKAGEANKPVTKITKADVREMIASIVGDKKRTKRGTVSHAAHHAFAYAKRIFAWAIKADDYGLEINPCSRVDIEEEVGGGKQSRDRILSDEELRVLWKAAADVSYPVGSMVKMLLLSACRLREIAHARWGEIVDDAESNDGPMLIVPSARVKGRNATATEHVVPLTGAMLDVLAEVPRFHGGVFVFSTMAGMRPISGFSALKRRLDATLRKHDPDMPHWQFHDLRRTARSLTSRAGVNADAAERCLHHTIGGVRGIYDRHEYTSEKRHALEKLAALVERITNPPADNVVPITKVPA